METPELDKCIRFLERTKELNKVLFGEKEYDKDLKEFYEIKLKLNPSFDKEKFLKDIGL